MIDKHIHYVWLGGGNKPLDVLRCIQTWKDILGEEYEITEWNEENLKIESPFYKFCLDQKQWAYASDYARLWVLYNFGGIYLDTDMEVYRPFNKDVLNSKAFFAYENNTLINAAIVASIPHNDQIKGILDLYDELIIVEPIPNLITALFKINPRYNQESGLVIGERALYYPDLKKHNNYYTVHKLHASWVNDWNRFKSIFFENSTGIKDIFSSNSYKYQEIMKITTTLKEKKSPYYKVIFETQLKDMLNFYIYHKHIKRKKYSPQDFILLVKDLGADMFKLLTFYQLTGLVFKCISFKKYN